MKKRRRSGTEEEEEEKNRDRATCQRPEGKIDFGKEGMNDLPGQELTEKCSKPEMSNAMDTYQNRSGDVFCSEALPLLC